MTLKDLLGADYNENLTHEQIDGLLADRKIVDLKNGKYVDKEKYTTLEKNYNDLKESTKDYETLKTENDNYKLEKAKAENIAILKKLNVNEDFNEFLISKFDGKVDEEKAKEYLKEHKQYLNAGKDNKIKIDFVPSKDGDGAGKTTNDIMNNLLRGVRNND